MLKFPDHVFLCQATSLSTDFMKFDQNLIEIKYFCSHLGKKLNSFNGLERCFGFYHFVFPNLYWVANPCMELVPSGRLDTNIRYVCSIEKNGKSLSK